MEDGLSVAVWQEIDDYLENTVALWPVLYAWTSFIIVFPYDWKKGSAMCSAFGL